MGRKSLTVTGMFLSPVNDRMMLGSFHGFLQGTGRIESICRSIASVYLWVINELAALDIIPKGLSQSNWASMDFG